MSKYDSLVKWANKNGYNHRDMQTDGKITGVLIDTDLYTGPYPDMKTWQAVQDVKKACAKRGIRCNAHHMLISVYCFTNE